MKTFKDFITEKNEQLSIEINTVAADPAFFASLDSLHTPEQFKTQEFANLLRVANLYSFALLRVYHEWLSEQLDP